MPPTASGITCVETTYAAGETEAWGACGTPRNMLLCEPTQPGNYPVFVWVGGTDSTYDDFGRDQGIEVTTIREMAARGYVAISPEYSGSKSQGGHIPLWDASAKPRYTATATCLFSPDPGTAVSTACAWRDGTYGVGGDCTQGIVVSGHSQGGTLAILAKNLNSGIDAAVAYASAPPIDPIEGPASEFLRTAGGRALDDHHLRAAIGANDPFNSIWLGAGKPAGGTAAVIANALNALTGQACPITGTSAENTDCLRSDNSGWVIPYPENLTCPNPAQHTFQLIECPIGTDSEGNGCPLDPLVWSELATGSWGLMSSLNWLDHVRAQDHAVAE